MSKSLKLLTPLIFIFLFITVGCNAPIKNFSIQNPINVERTDQLIVLTRSDLEKSLGDIEDGKFVEIKDANNQKITLQFDDLNEDKKWDEVAFLYSFKPNEDVTFSIDISDSNKSENTVRRANVRLRKKDANDKFGGLLTEQTMPLKNPPTDFSKQPLPMYLTEGPAWENDKVAFRLYFDTRNGKDIFGKSVPGMVMDTIGMNVNNSYHELSNWGMDILHVGNSLGAGAIAFKIKEKGKDTLIRLGGENVTNETYKQIADGPIRAIFQMNYDWTLSGKPVQVIDETSIWGGQYFYQTKITIKNAPFNVELVTGIADFYDNKSDYFNVDSATILYSFGPQSENHDDLGMAILIPRRNFISPGETQKEDHNGPVIYKQKIFDTHYISQTIFNNTPSIYRFYSAWEKTDTNFVSLNYFKKFLREQGLLFSNPVRVNW